jgi:hypothetical protein
VCGGVVVVDLSYESLNLGRELIGMGGRRGQ